MTAREVHIDLRHISVDEQGRPPAEGFIHFSPTHRHRDGRITVLKVFRRVQLINGEATVSLEPTGPDWCYMVKEPPGGIKRFVAVPISPAPQPPDPQVLEYNDLQDIDPKTLEPSVHSVPAWEAAVQQARELSDEARALVPLMESTVGAVGVVQFEAQAAIAAAEAASANADKTGQDRSAVSNMLSTAPETIQDVIDTLAPPTIEALAPDIIESVAPDPIRSVAETTLPPLVQSEISAQLPDAVQLELVSTVPDAVGSELSVQVGPAVAAEAHSAVQEELDIQVGPAVEEALEPFSISFVDYIGWVVTR